MKMLKWTLGPMLLLFILTGLYLTYRNHFKSELRPARLQQAAMADLSLITIAQERFRAYHGTYTTDLSSLNVKPKYTYYKVGFVKPAQVEVRETPPNYNPAIMDFDLLKNARQDLDVDLSKETKLDSFKVADLAKFCEDCTANKDSFKAIAAANLDEDADLDIWTVNEKGEFTHIIDDLK